LTDEARWQQVERPELLRAGANLIGGQLYSNWDRPAPAFLQQ